LIAFIEDTASRQIVTMKAHRKQTPCHSLRCRGEWLLALALAEVELRRSRDRHLDDAVGQLAGHHLVEPDAVQAWMLLADDLQDLLPDGWIQNR
jgi:hypothetical protein